MANLSISTNAFGDKNQIQWGAQTYTQQQITLNEFETAIKNGYNFCHCFDTAKPIFGVAEKTNKNFKQADFIFIDVDDSKISMTEFLMFAKLRPTIAYTTANNYKKSNNYLFRYRLGYLLNQPITSVAEYEKTYLILTQELQKNIPNFVITDNCGKSPSQQFAGNPKCEFFKSDYVLDLDKICAIEKYDVLLSNNIHLNGTKPETEKPEENKIIKEPQEKNIFIEPTFFKDFYKLSDLQMIEKYHEKFEYFDHSKLDYKEGFALLGDDYYQISRSWNFETTTDTDGNVKFNGKKLSHGDGRIRKLFIAALIMKKILPTITATHLLFNLICERHYFYNNSDGMINHKKLLNIVKNVMAKKHEEIKVKKGTTKKFVVDKRWCRENGTTPNAQKNVVRKQLNYEKIGEVYDCSLSVSKNLKMFQEMGIKTSRRTLYRFCSEMGINPKGEK